MPHAALWVVQLDSREEALDKEFVSMPHAALWVVQHAQYDGLRNMLRVSMPHAALWVVQQKIKRLFEVAMSRFNAARGFVGGAALMARAVPFIANEFQCRTRLCGWCSRHACFDGNDALCRFNAARGFVGGAARDVTRLWIEGWTFQCRTRLCGWCSKTIWLVEVPEEGFNAARGFVGGAAGRDEHSRYGLRVSMPHAALWVVQPALDSTTLRSESRFQCRTRLCGWCNQISLSK